MDTTPNTSPQETPDVDPPAETNSPTDQDSSGTVDPQNTSRNVSLPSYYESTPLVSAPVPQAADTTQSEESPPAQQNDHLDQQSVTVDISEDQEQVTTSNANSLPEAQEQNPYLPYPSQPEQQVNFAYPPTTLPYPNPSTDLTYPPLGTTETPALFPEQFPLPASTNPPNTGIEQSSGNEMVEGDSGTTNETPLIENEDITQGDGQMVSHGRHGLMKLPSYAGGGEYPAEPPPSYEDSNPIPVPQAMEPRQPSSAPQPGFTPPTQLISRNFGTTPIYTICPACGEEIQTVTVHVPGALTYLMVCIFLMLGWWFMCCLIPFCVQGFKDVHHVCPNCKKTIGRYDRIGN